MEELKNIIKEIQTYKQFGLNASDDAILDAATRIFNTQTINNKKFQTPEKTFNMAKKGFDSQMREKATEKQLKYLKQLGYTGTTDLTKFAAGQIIQEKISQSENI